MMQRVDAKRGQYKSRVWEVSWLREPSGSQFPLMLICRLGASGWLKELESANRMAMATRATGYMDTKARRPSWQHSIVCSYNDVNNVIFPYSPPGANAIEWTGGTPAAAIAAVGRAARGASGRARSLPRAGGPRPAAARAQEEKGVVGGRPKPRGRALVLQGMPLQTHVSCLG